MEVRPVFIIGPPRTGTTLVSFLLGGSDCVLSLSEPFHAHAILPRWLQYRLFAQFQRKAGLTFVRPPWRFDQDRLFSFLRDVATRNGLTHLVMKETFHNGCLPVPWCNYALLDRFAGEGHAIIGVVRHPYDTAASTVKLLHRLVFGVTGTFLRLLLPRVPRFASDADILRWTVDNYARFFAWARNRKLFIVRYEDLVNTPEPEVRRMCAHAGIPFDERMLDHGHARRAFGGIGAPEVLYRAPRPVNSASVGKGKDLTEEQRAVIRDGCAEAAAAYDYTW